MKENKLMARRTVKATRIIPRISLFKLDLSERDILPIFNNDNREIGECQRKTKAQGKRQ